jgi:phage protein D
MPAITYTLLVDNAPAPPSLVESIEHIEAESKIGLASILRLRLATALSDDGDRWVNADDGLFSRLASIRLLATVGIGLPTVVFDGYVTETTLSLSAEPGESTFEVIAMDITARMNLEEKVRQWPNMPDSAIAALILGEYGLVPITVPTQPIRIQLETTVTQRDTDIRFLRHLAQRNGFDVYVKPGPLPGLVEGHFHAPMLDLPPQGVLSVDMGEATNVSGFNVKYEMLRPTKASVAGVDARSVDDQPADADSGELTELGSRAVLNGGESRQTVLRTAGLSKTGELQILAQATVERSTWAVTAEGEVSTEVYGDVIQPGATILVRGAGSTFSGTYFVERVLHRFDDDHVQQFTLRRNAIEPTGFEIYLDDSALPG